MSSLSESPEEEEEADTPEDESRDVWPSEAGSDDATPPSSAVSHVDDSWTGSPRKRTQTLPSLGCPATVREPGWRWSRFQESFNENDEKTLSEDIFKILDLDQKVTIFSRGQKGENEKVEVEKEQSLDKTGTDGIVRKADTKAQVQSTGPLPEPRLSKEASVPHLGREKPTAVDGTAVKQTNVVQPENTDTAHTIRR